MNPRPDVKPYDALLLLSFGGPEKPEDVVPFLENVTRGRGIPRERLDQVGEHYFLFGGKSPINDQNRALHRRAREGPRRAGHRPAGLLRQPQLGPLPRRHARADDRRRRPAGRGHRHVGVLVVVVVPAVPREPLRRGRADPGRAAPRQAAAVLQPPGLRRAGRRRLPRRAGRAARRAATRAPARLRHPLRSRPRWPRPAAPRTRPASRAGPTSRQHRSAVDEVAAPGAASRPGARHRHDLVYCSRSGAPSTPWLEPDVNDHLEQLATDGVSAVVLVPIGFVSDHMEVIYDLDTEAMATAERLGHARPCAPRPPASTRGSWRWCATSCWSGPPPSGASSRERPAVGSMPAGPDVCGVGLLPQPARRRVRPCAGATRDATRSQPARPRPRRRPRGCRPGPRDAARRHRRRRHQDQRRRRGHRGRPRGRGADPRPDHRGSAPTTRSWARRATTAPAPAGCAGSSTRSTAPSTTSTASPDCAVSVAAEVDGEVVAGAVVTIPTGVEYAAALGPRRHPRRPAHRRPAHPAARRAPGPDRLRLPARGPRAPGRLRGRGCCPRCATSAGWAPARSTCATSPTAAPTATSRPGRSRWDWSAGGLVLREAGGRFEPARRHPRLRRIRRAVRSWWAPRRTAGTTFVEALASRGVRGLTGRLVGRAGPRPGVRE